MADKLQKLESSSGKWRGRVRQALRLGRSSKILCFHFVPQRVKCSTTTKKDPLFSQNAFVFFFPFSFTAFEKKAPDLEKQVASFTSPEVFSDNTAGIYFACLSLGKQGYPRMGLSTH